jgi:hypothetical protein
MHLNGVIHVRRDMKRNDVLFWAAVAGIIILPTAITLYIIHKDNRKEGYPMHLKGDPIPLMCH